MIDISPRRQEHVLLASAVLGAALAAWGVWVIVQSYSTLMYSDYWGTIDLYQLWLNGSLAFSDLRDRIAEHRLLVSRLFYLADYLLSDGDQLLNFWIIAATNVAHALVLTWVVSRSTEDRRIVAVFGTLAVALMLSPAQYENLTWGFQVPFVQVYLFASLGIIGPAAMQSHQPRSLTAFALFVGACVSATLSTYSMANGMLVWPIMLVLSLYLRLPLAYVGALAAIAAAVIFSYLFDFERPDIYNDYSKTLTHPATFLQFVTHYLAGPVKYIGNVPKILVGGITLAVVAAIGLHALLRPVTCTRWQWVFIGIMGFIVATAAVTALGRAGFHGVEHGVSKRYATPAVVLYVALFGYLATGALARSRSGAVLAVAAMAIFALAATLVYQQRIPRWIDKVAGREQAMVAYLAGARPADLLDLIGRVWQADKFAADVAFLRDHRLSIFTDPLFANDPPSRVDLGATVAPEACAAAVARFSSRPDEGTTIVVEAGGGGFRPRRGWLLVLAEDGQRIAYGIPGIATRDYKTGEVVTYGPAVQRPERVRVAYLSAEGEVLCTSAPVAVE